MGNLSSMSAHILHSTDSHGRYLTRFKLRLRAASILSPKYVVKGVDESGSGVVVLCLGGLSLAHLVAFV